MKEKEIQTGRDFARILPSCLANLDYSINYTKKIRLTDPLYNNSNLMIMNTTQVIKKHHQAKKCNIYEAHHVPGTVPSTLYMKTHNK